MAGIYIHIPFCRQACHYCDFHFSTSLKGKKDFLDAIKKEISLQKNYLSPLPLLEVGIGSIYFGGGTPSILSKDEILEIFDELSKYFVIDADAEITLEANPDDLSKENLSELSLTPINRLSIGVQSFSDVDLKFLNRTHDAKRAIASVQDAQNVGFKNITIDLIYGMQTLTNSIWEKNIEKTFLLDIQHISCYSLTVEPRTALYSFIQKGEMENINSKKSTEQFKILMDEMQKNKFIHYEISNFCKEKFYSKHNSNYWKGVSYLGLGPSAHSYNGNSRQWNVSNNATYIKSIMNNHVPFEKEVLSENQKYNEYILTSLRTMWGMDLNFVKEKFSEQKSSYLQEETKQFLNEQMISQKDEKIYLTNKGKLFADKIASDLFFIPD